MIRWAVILLIVAIIAALLAFGGFVVGVIVDIAQVLFWIFVVLFVVALVWSFISGRRTL